MDKHACHPEIVTRLKRASGHLLKVIAMIEAGEACEEVAQQLQAVSNALVAAKRQYVTEHIENCLEIQEGVTLRDVIAQVKALKTMTKYL
ncbi:MAG: metal-sensing transcriptional repressor [Magnetococcales bacterium]|nr:metal-sensing transcriptional repressor [Magnetococcales bacterium]